MHADLRADLVHARHLARCQLDHVAGPNTVVHSVFAPGLHNRPYFHRFTQDNVDLCDVLASFTHGAKVTLHELSRIMGLPGKPDGIDGSRVDAYFRASRIQEISDYCRSDVVITYRLWLRRELFRGRLDQRQFEYSEEQLRRIHPA
jgi:predicted PolB exonuclease-like 3'-5' exonuclease